MATVIGSIAAFAAGGLAGLASQAVAYFPTMKLILVVWPEPKGMHDLYAPQGGAPGPGMYHIVAAIASAVVCGVVVGVVGTASFISSGGNWGAVWPAIGSAWAKALAANAAIDTLLYVLMRRVCGTIDPEPKKDEVQRQ